MMYNLKKTVLFLILFFSFSMSVCADGETAEGYSYTSPSYSGTTPNSLNRYGGGWDSSSNKAFRLTLIDFSGRKIDGTRSVDFSSNAFYKCSVDGVRQTCGFKDYSPIGGYYENGEYKVRYAYKYSKLHDDYNEPNDNMLIMYYDGVDVGGKGYFKDQNTVHELLKNKLLSRGWHYKNFDDITFYDMFLHYAGFLDDDTSSYLRLSASRQQILYNSVIIAEPVYPVYFISDKKIAYRYGTVTELAQYQLDHPGYGLAEGFNTTLKKNIALCVNDYDVKNKLGKLDFISEGVDDCSYAEQKDIVDPKLTYGVGIGILKGSETCVSGDEECPFTLNSNYTFNYCNRAVLTTSIDSQIQSAQRDSENMGTSISYSSDDATLSSEFLMSEDADIFKINEYSDESQSARCVDNVEYILDDVFSDLNSRFNKFTFVKTRPGRLMVSRTCLLGKNYTSGDQFKIDSYKESSLEIKFYNNVYTIFPSDSLENTSFNINNNIAKPSSFDDSKVTFTKVEERSVARGGDRNAYKYVTYNFNLYYVIPEHLMFIGNGDFDSQGYVKLSNLENAFGYSQNKVNQDFEMSIGLANYNRAICPLDYKIDYSTKTNISFRTISLRNPFPARDGTSRLPAENWLSTSENNVYSYITNNRGVMMIYDNDDPEMMYSVREPMYTITLTPSVMLNIRKYNKMYSYYSMYKLEDGFVPSDNVSPNDKDADKLICNSDGRECYSQFLRDNKYLPQEDESVSAISGVCFFGRNTNDDEKIRNAFNELYDPVGVNRSNGSTYTNAWINTYLAALTNSQQFNEENAENGSDAQTELNNALSYGADENFNGRFDSEDIDIMLLYAKSSDENSKVYGKYKQNAYYTCAHKTFKSGGPVEEDEE